jgi:hypothetical protein
MKSRKQKDGTMCGEREVLDTKEWDKSRWYKKLRPKPGWEKETE